MSLKSLFMSCVQVLKASRYNSAENKLLKAVKCFEPLKIFLDMLLASFAALVPNVGCRAHFCRPEKYLQIDQKIFTSLKIFTWRGRKIWRCPHNRWCRDHLLPGTARCGALRKKYLNPPQKYLVEWWRDDVRHGNCNICRVEVCSVSVSAEWKRLK